MFILVQILGGITLVIFAISFQQRKKENLLILQTIAIMFFILQYILTDRITGAVAFIIAAIRSIVFYWYKKKNKKPSVSVLVFFECTIVVSTIISWQNIFSAIPLVGTTLNTWGIWQDNMKYTRRTSLVAEIGWCIYNLSAQMYTAFLTELVNMISTIIAMWRFDRKRQLKE